MNLTRVTFTGADDSIEPRELAALSREYPFVEWGILMSRHYGTHRFPSAEWLLKLYAVSADNPEMHLSAHLCGQFVRELGTLLWWSATPNAWRFDRVQLNFHGQRNTVQAELPNHHQYILQADGVNDDWIKQACHRSKGIFVPLFDQSGGAGVSPGEWPQAWPGIVCGYAGGIGPDNVVAELNRIDEVTEPKAPIWIDMERKVRSADDARFDLKKVEAVLKLVAPIAGKQTS